MKYSYDNLPPIGTAVEVFGDLGVVESIDHSFSDCINIRIWATGYMKACEPSQVKSAENSED